MPLRARARALGKCPRPASPRGLAALLAMGASDQSKRVAAGRPQPLARGSRPAHLPASRRPRPGSDTTHLKEKIIFICNINKVPLLVRDIYICMCVCIYVGSRIFLHNIIKQNWPPSWHTLIYTNPMHLSESSFLKVKERKRTMYSMEAFCQFLDWQDFNLRP